MVELFAKSGDPDQTPQNDPDQTLRSAASDLDRHCLPITPLEDSRMRWVKSYLRCRPIYNELFYLDPLDRSITNRRVVWLSFYYYYVL